MEELPDERATHERYHDRRILEKVTSKKPLLDFERKMRQEADLVEEAFAKQMELADIVQAENRKRFNILPDQVEDGGDAQSLEGKEREPDEGRKEVAQARNRDRSPSPNVPFKKPVTAVPQYVNTYFHREIEPVIGKDARPGREPGLQRSVIPEIKTDTIFDQYNRTFN